MTSRHPHLVTFRAKDPLDRLFEIGIVLKGLNGVIELAAGTLLLFLTPLQISTVVHDLTRRELTTDPSDPFASSLLAAADHLTGSGLHFGAAYLLIHGGVKVVLVVALLRDKLWAYPLMILVLSGFIVFQLYRLAAGGSSWLIVLTSFDAVVLALTIREYRVRRARRRKLSPVGS